MKLPKYRAWDIQQKIMRDVNEIIGFLVKDPDFPIVICLDDIELLNGKYELMQSTGLKDDECEEIFAGDYLKIDHDEWNESEIVEVKWCGDKYYPAFDIPDSSLSGESNGLSLMVQDVNYDYVVIGNVWDNPELLEV